MVILDPLPLDEDEDEQDRDLERTLQKISPTTFRSFVLVTVLVQAGLFTVSLGLLLIIFRGEHSLGSLLLGGGLFAFTLAFVTFRRYRE